MVISCNIDRENVCVSDSDCGSLESRGVCQSRKCQCNRLFTGVLCEKRIAGSLFTARQLHSTAYDSANDIAYVSFGQSLDYFYGSSYQYEPSILVYDFKLAERDADRNPMEPSPNAWSAINTLNGPSSRFGHYSFVFDQELYLVGGNTQYGTTFEIWKYTPSTTTWILLGNKNNGLKPIELDSSQAVFYPGTTTMNAGIYVYGGVTSSNVVSSSMYFYDLKNQYWYIRNKNGISLYGATAVFHERSNSIYFTGGYRFQNEYRVQRYSIDSDLWFTIGLINSKNNQNSSVYTQAEILDDGRILMLGGEAFSNGQTDEFSNRCFTNDINVFDTSCQTWMTYKLDGFNLKGRTGHSIVKRGEMVWILGGYDGTYLGDMFAINIKDIISTPENSALKRQQCEISNWCASYSCKDCQEKSYCVYDLSANTCNYNSQKQLQGLPKTACPILKTIPFASENGITDSLNANSSADYQVYIDTIFGKIQIAVSSSSSQFLTLSLFSLESMTTRKVGGSNPVLIFTEGDPLRHVGPYTIRVSNPGDGISYTIKVTRQPSTIISSPEGVNGSPSNNSVIYELLNYSSGLLFFLAIWFALSTFFRRQRIRTEQMRAFREFIQEGVHATVPTLFIVCLGLSFRLKRQVGDPVNFGHKRPKTLSLMTLNQNRASVIDQFSNGISSFLKLVSFSNDNLAKDAEGAQLKIETGEMKKQDSIPLKILGSSYTDEKRHPLSVEKIQVSVEDPMPNLVGISYFVIFPDAERYISEGLLPPTSIGIDLNIEKV